VRRILTAAGVESSDKDAYWLGRHMERFVAHARMHGELLDLPLAIESYLASRRVEVRAPADWYMAQARQPAGDRFYMGRRCGNRSATGSTSDGRTAEKVAWASCPMGLRFFSLITGGTPVPRWGRRSSQAEPLR